MGILQKIIDQSATKMPSGLALSSDSQGSKNLETKSFPQDVYPEVIQNVINATSATLLFPVDYTASTILVAASGAIGNCIRAKVKNGYCVTAQLYMFLVGRPGTIKSHVLNYGLSPIFLRDKDLYKSYVAEVKLYEQTQQLSAKDPKEKGEPIIHPILKKHIISDATIEAVNFVLSHNRKGLICCIDEGIGWIKNLNRYRSGSDQEYWLSVWSGKPIISDRRSSEPINIQNPFISFIGTIQPSVLTELSKEGRDSNGFIDRILFAYPENLVVNPWTETELDEQVTKDYQGIIQRLLDIEPVTDETGEIIPQDIKYSPQAFKNLKSWQAHNAQLSNSCEDPEIGGIYSKLEIYCIRFSLILQSLYWAAGEDEIHTINERAVSGAIKIAEYFRGTSLKIFEQVHNIDPVERLSELQQRFYNALPYSFKTSKGQETALQYEIPERTFKRMLKNEHLFKKVRHGEYEKVIDELQPSVTKFVQ